MILMKMCISLTNQADVVCLKVGTRMQKNLFFLSDPDGSGSVETCRSKDIIFKKNDMGGGNQKVANAITSCNNYNKLKAELSR